MKTKKTIGEFLVNIAIVIFDFFLSIKFAFDRASMKEMGYQFTKIDDCFGKGYAITPPTLADIEKWCKRENTKGNLFFSFLLTIFIVIIIKKFF